MSSIDAVLEAPGMSLRDYLGIVTRRRVVMLLVFAAGIIITALVAALLPARYQSAATILIEQQEIPADLVRSTVTSYADQRIQVITQRVMTTQTLLDIIQRYNLYPTERNKATREALLKQMREDISVRMISADVVDPRSGKPTTANVAFSVGFSNPSPEQTARVANELTTLFLNENLTTRSRLAEEAQSFLSGEADRVNRHVEELETALEKFKAKHLETLPELTQLNMTLLDRTDQALEQLETRKSSLEQQLVYLQSTLVQIKPNSMLLTESGERILTPADKLKSARAELANDRALYTADYPDIPRLEREIAGLEAQNPGAVDLNDLRRELESARTAAADASQRYSPEHPDRMRLERQVKMLEEELDRAVRAAPAPRAAPTTSDNPAYIQIQSQISATNNELEALKGEQERLRAHAADYQTRITLSPQIEKEYRELVRDYDTSRAKYQELRAKQAEATVSRDLETDRKGERFTLIEPPLVPQEPVSPNRPLIAVLGIVLSLGLAVGAVALLESLDDTIRGRRDLSLLVGGSPLAIIPLIAYQEAVAGPPRWRRFLLVGAGTVGALALALLAIHLLYRPLDVLWFVVLRKLGMG
jgi:uncharacterized protein involved in exopolysaccharide biosynthesis